MIPLLCTGLSDTVAGEAAAMAVLGAQYTRYKAFFSSHESGL